MSTHPSSRRLIKASCGVAVAAVVMMSATAAFADGSNDSAVPGASAKSVGAIQAKCDAAIAVRMTKLGALSSEVGGASNLTDAHRQSLDSIIATTGSNLAALKTQIDAATTVAELRPLCASIVVDNRVYVLRGPQTDVTIRLDNDAAHVVDRRREAAELQGRIDAKKAEGKDTTTAEADLAKMNTAIAAAQSAESGRADALLAVTPGDYNANHNVVAPYRGAAVKSEVANGHALYWGARTAAALARLH